MTNLNLTNPMNLNVIGGAGYVGLITSSGLAEPGNQVVTVDVDEERPEKLREGIHPIYKEGLKPPLRRYLEAGWTGVQAQAYDHQGDLLDDDDFRVDGNLIYGCKASSLAATRALATGQTIADRNLPLLS